MATKILYLSLVFFDEFLKKVILARFWAIFDLAKYYDETFIISERSTVDIFVFIIKKHYEELL